MNEPILPHIHYPILEALITNEGLSTMELADLLGITKKTLYSKRMGRVSWTLDECIILRDILAQDLSIEELFYILPVRTEASVRLTEQEMRGGFNPALYKD